jgi:peroxiredoxin
MALETADGERVRLREWRGAPLLLYLFATFDLGSQLALVPLKRVMASNPSLQVLGIAVQADPAPLLPIYAQELEVTFPLLYDPQSEVVEGRSPLGPIPAVPAFLWLDATGEIRGRYLGVPSEAELEALLAL